ncbi:malto-oligosyltrehalose synthase [Microvirga sp. 2TAF3]|uniref:malto-oligosyltrehalose synthase n=1 Tax=Microvirga sp. 2TAF3 TaxID=3233014 RepID=UPI003F9A330C
MSRLNALLDRMAALVGIAPRYTDAFGRSVDISLETRQAMLEGFGLGVRSEDEARESFLRLKRLKGGTIPALVPVEAGDPTRLRLRSAPHAASWQLIEESGTTQEGHVPDEGTLHLPPLPVGYHHLTIGETTATLIAAPSKCWQPDILQGQSRLWGAAAQVYSLRSERDFGIGDYSDVALAAERVAALGGAFLGLSPVHALFAADRSKISPYSPSSRLFLESIHIDPTAIDGFNGSEAARLFDGPEMKERLAQLRKGIFVDHAAVWRLKRQLLDALWDRHRDRQDHSTFEDFRRAGGEALEAHATFEALSEHFRAQGLRWLGDWPEAYRSARSDAVHRFRSEHAERVTFHAWLQWLADRQLANAAERAHAAGMPICLYRDLAVGADRGGSEVWSAPERYAATLSVGAPPDPLGPQGQNWGLPPFNPLDLETQGLAPFRELVAANMLHAGAIRIDHAFQLQRLFLIPSDMPATQGAYVDYPFEAMLAVLRVESHRARCLVIAEDLGTAPEGFSDAIMASGILSYRVLPFEREEGGGFKRPELYPRSALAALTTHDLPTFAGWWRGLDIDLRQTFGVFEPERAEAERAARAADRMHFAKALFDEGLFPGPDPPNEVPLGGALRYLVRTESQLMALQMEDAAGELNQANMPGPDAGHPNWRRRLPMQIEAMTAPGSRFAKLAAALAEEGRDARPRAAALASPPPRATYRLQFHKDFTFDDAAAIVPYLAKLGISHVYASPIQTARPGSMHGYDIVDPAAINPELGGEKGFRRFSDTLKAHGLGLLLDIVPNHMGIGGKDNRWWLSVLEWGRLSPFAEAFDIDWERVGAQGKLVVPFLGASYGDTLEKSDLRLAFDPTEGSFSIWHWEHRFPINPATYPMVLDQALASLENLSGSSELSKLTESLQRMDTKASPERHRHFPSEADKAKRRLADAVATQPILKNAIERTVAAINGAPGIPESHNILHLILEKQSYRLAYWRVASSDINYRRFFDINDLAGLRIENPKIFERVHDLIFRLVDEKWIDGLRIDHIDGLADPKSYLHALQDRIGPGFYVVVEKILEPGEDLRRWPVAGTTGYDALNLIDGVLVDSGAEETLDRLYRNASGLHDGNVALLRWAKGEIVAANFTSELEALVADLKRIADADRRTRDLTIPLLRQALVDIVAAFPVYRSYLDRDEPAPEDVELIASAIDTAKGASSLPDCTGHDFIAAVLLGRIEIQAVDTPDDVIRRFTRRFQQLTGPVMAKSLEDTLFYRYGRLIALNEVGGDPCRFGLGLSEFHEANEARARNWPNGMIATATHDTKRGEDARARLLALSEMPQEWAQALDLWRELATPDLTQVGGALAPDANDRIILLQALLGAWPLELLADDDESLSEFRKRMETYVVKALREAKRQTSWIAPHAAYEEAACTLLAAFLQPESAFIESFRPLAHRLAFLGALSGLSRTILKATLPGVPDIYQGTESWDFSLVDPDNRRPVDYAARAQTLDAGVPLATLFENWRDGRIKQHILMRLLRDRAEAPALYANGDYRPLAAEGSQASHVIAFTRQHRDETLAVVVPRLWASLAKDGQIPLPGAIWGDTSIALPEGRWREVITSRDVTIENDWTAAGELLAPLPFAVLRRLG